MCRSEKTAVLPILIMFVTYILTYIPDSGLFNTIMLYLKWDITTFLR